MAMLNKVIERDGDNVLTSAMIDLKEFRVSTLVRLPHSPRSLRATTQPRALILVAEPHTG